jgi:hypothetical protein
MNKISRQEFLQRTSLAGAAMLLSSLETLALSENKKIKVGVISCGSKIGAMKNFQT